MLYLDDQLPGHPKILAAGKKIGRNGPALALAMYVTGLSYARNQTTDGFLPDAFLRTCFAFTSPIEVAKALADPRVKLWERRRGGYQIHDYHDWNKTAKELRDRRKKWREKKANQRAMSPGDKTGTSPACTSTHVPRTTYHVPPVRGSSTVRVLTDASRRHSHETKNITHRILCSMVRAEIEADARIAYADLVEAVKVRIARQGFAYPTGAQLSDAIEAVEHATRRRIAS